MLEKFSNHLQTNPYYHSLTDSYTRSILNSGLLLDEDLEVLLSFYQPHPTPQHKYKPSIKLPASLASLLASIVLAKKIDSKLILIPSVLITTLSVTLEILDVRRRRKENELLDDLIDVLRKTHKINGQLISYTKARQELTSDELTHHRKIEDFFKILSKNQQAHFQVLINAQLEIGSTIDALTDDLNCLKTIDIPSNLALEEFTIEVCFSQTKRVQDIQIWLTSKLLSYIGIVFNSATEQTMEFLLATTLPHLLNSLVTHYEDTRRLFNHLRDSVCKWSEFRSQTKDISKKFTSTKLENTISSLVNNLSLISEKSQGILNQIDNSGSNPEDLNKSLLDLRRHTYATYESLDLLCKLYGALSSSDKIATKVEATSKPAAKLDSSVAVPMVRYDDKTEPLEEHFDLYIDKDDTEETEAPRRYSGDSSGAFAGLMLQELKQSLKQHERFVQAKQRRGSLEEEEKVTQVVVPEFDLKVLRSDSLEGKRGLETVEVGVEDSLLPPPLPPPLPTKLFDLSQVGEVYGQGSEQKSMFEGIKALSGQLSGQEEVFGAD